MGLPWDAWLQVVIQTDGLRIILLSMTCKGLRTHIANDHMLWRRLYIAWEWQNRLSFRFAPFMCRGVRPPEAPRRGWQLGEVPDKAQFNAVARKAVTLSVVRCCGLCGQTRRKTLAVWALGKRVCVNCMRGNLVSNEALRAKYGISLTEPLVKGGAVPFMEACFGKVLFFERDAMGDPRKMCTYDPGDYDKKHYSLMFFWAPHLRQLVDLDERYRRKKAHEAAGVLLHALILRRGVLRAMSATHTGGVRQGPSTTIVLDGFTRMSRGTQAAVLLNLQDHPLGRHTKGAGVRRPWAGLPGQESLWRTYPHRALLDRARSRTGLL